MRSIAFAFTAPFFLVPGVAQSTTHDRAKLEAKFEKLMSGCKMVGRFTETGSDKPSKKDTYTISKVTKLERDRWRFDAKIEYGKRSVTVPVIVDVRWAGDTPVIQVTDMKIRMLGTYTARVVIYRDEYAGMWSGGGHGGHMFGRIERDAKAAKPVQQRQAAWNSWRGSDGTAVARAANPPTEWGEDKNIRWKVTVPGVGSSSPIIWGDRVYVTTAIETDRDGKAPAPASAGRRGGFMSGRAPTKTHEFAVLALSRKDGSVIWQRKVTEAVPHEAGHTTASQASNSPLTDGKRIYASFGSRGLHCLDMDGNVLWSKQLGLMRTRMGFGEGSSPALYGNTIVINQDHEGDSFVAAFDTKTGKELWRKPRQESTSWSTPLIVPVDGRHQVIIAASRASRSYDLESGDIVWTCSGMTANAIPTPIHVGGTVYLMSGFRGSAMQAIRLAGAKGDLTDSDHIVWKHGRSTSYTPSALVYDNYIYFVRGNSGVLSCLDTKTGEVHYEGQRLRSFGATVYSSPVGAAGRVYLTSRRGRTKVIKLGSTYEVLATNKLRDTFDASPALVDGELYLRGRDHLYCIARK